MKRRIPSLMLLVRPAASPRLVHGGILAGLEVPSTFLHYPRATGVQLRKFTLTRHLRLNGPKDDNQYDKSNARPAVELSHNITQEEKDDYEKRLEEDKDKQIRTPWHREGSDIPPVARQRSAGAMTKGENSENKIPRDQVLT